MQKSHADRSPSQSTAFLGDPQRWPSKPATFTGGFSWINKDASNVNSKAHIAKVRAHVRNEYRYWKPGNSPKAPTARGETSGRSSISSPVGKISPELPLGVVSTEILSSRRDMVRNGSSSATSVRSPDTAVGTSSNSPQKTSAALVLSQQCNVPRREFFDPVRGSLSVLETASDPRKEYERRNQQQMSRPMPTKLADPAKLISDAKNRDAQVQPAPASRSKHESDKLLREIRDYNAKQAALQIRSLQTSIGGLRDDPFLSFPIESRRSVIEAADYWVNSWAPAQTPGYIKAGSWKPTSDKVFSITTADEGAFESQVALAQSYLSRNKSTSEEPSKEVLYHQTRAMLSLRKHLEAGSVSAGPLLSSLNLLIMSIVHADRKAYDFHRKGLERMIRTPPTNSTTTLLHAVITGYFATSAFYFRLLKYQTCPLAARTLINEPTLPPTKLSIIYPTHPFPPLLTSTISTLPSGFRELALELILPLPLLLTLASITMWNRFIAPGQSTQGVAIWFSWDDCSATLSLLEALPRDSDTLARPLSLVLLLYSITAHNRFHASRIYVQLVRDALDAVRGLDPKSKAQAECRLWMAIVAAGCARDVGAGNARVDSGGLVLEVMRGMGKGGDMGWEMGEEILKRFFWYEHFRENWKMCWV